MKNINYSARMMNTIFLVVCLIILICIIISPPNYEEDKIIKGSCYDYYENKINGINCDIIEEGYSYEDRIGGILVFVSLTAIFAALTFFSYKGEFDE